MFKISISDEFSEKVPFLRLYCISCNIVIEKKSLELWEKIDKESDRIKKVFQLSDISKIPAVLASRNAYKACGKDPARYRPSAEALLRRTIKGNDLYKINNVVDLLNLVSLSTGFSIGGYDESKIIGEITFEIGEKDEDYQAIGRGEFNIEFLPVLRDKTGAFGSPTSDSQRTCVDNNTKKFLMVIFDFNNNPGLNEASKLAVRLLERYASATSVEQCIIKNF